MALICYPIFAGWGVVSEVPSWFGRYSTFLLVFNVAGAGLVMFAAAAWWQGKPLWGVAGCVALSFAPFGNNSLGDLPMMGVMMWGVRLAAAIGFVGNAFQAHLNAQKSPASFVFGAVLLIQSLMDLGLFVVVRSRQQERGDELPYRYAYDLSRIHPEDYVLVGDSFVWGQGVSEGREFGALLEGNLGDGRRVYMLGQIGTGLTRYEQSIEQIPGGCKAKRIVVCYYHNDFPAPERLVDRIQMFGASVGRGAPSLRFAGDMLAKITTPTPETYLTRLAANYSQNNSGHERRLAQLRAELKGCFDAALEHSVERPGLLILPGLLDFGDNAFAAGHELVGAMALNVGFEVFDSLETFKRQGAAAKDLWASSNDCHFNDRGHEIVAGYLFGILEPKAAQAR